MNKLCYLILYLQIVISISAPLQTRELIAEETSQNIPTLLKTEIAENLRHMQLAKSTLKSQKESLQKEISPITKSQNYTQELLKPMKEEHSKETELPISEKKTRQMPFQMLQLPMSGNSQMQYPMSLPIPMVERYPPEMNLPLLQMSMTQDSSLQQQMLALQQIQDMQNMETVHAPSSFYLPQDQQMLLLLPSSIDDINTQETKTRDEPSSDDINNKENIKHGFVDEELDSVILEAEPEMKNKMIHHKKGFRKAILLVPGQRFSIGGIISSIPWLPIEINVPDTIAWAYNGIANGIGSIISIIGQRWRFKRPMVTPAVAPVAIEDDSQVNMKMFLKQLHNQNAEVIQSPVMVIPVNEVLPIRKAAIPISPIMMPVFGNMLIAQYPQMKPSQI